MKKLQKRRLETLLCSILLVILTGFNAYLAGKKFLYFDEYIHYEKDNYHTFLRNISLGIYFFFMIIIIFLVIAIFKYRGKLYDKLFRSYKVAGIINRYTVSPDFVQVVLKKNRKYYFPVTNEKGVLTNVIPLTPDEVRDITKLKGYKLNNYDLHSFTFGENCYYIFQTDENKLFIGNLKSFRIFLNDFETNNSFIKKRINKFLSETVSE